MSGDVQPRKRKDKKKKRESLDVRKSEGELIFSRKHSLHQDDEASHGVHITKMGTDDVLLHVHEEHGTGGHWCAKIIFFSLMAILMGLVCLIILENRGLSDVDTPLSESRFSNYFDGWVDERRNDHNDHHDSHGFLEHDDEHEGHDEHDDDHNEPYEEEVDHSDDGEELAKEEDDNVTPEEDEDDDNATAENIMAEEDDGEENEEEDDADDENVTVEDENVTKQVTAEENNDEDDDDDNDQANENDDDDYNVSKETSKSVSQGAYDDDDAADDDAFDDDDDGTFDSLEKIVDNDASELELLQERASQQTAVESQRDETSAENDIENEAHSAPSWASSQIKPKAAGGPQSIMHDGLDSFERELRKANDEMMQEFNYH